jgi:hypothetical protein
MPLCEGTRHVFLGRAKGKFLGRAKGKPDRSSQEARRGVHQRRSGYAAWIFKPAATAISPTSPTAVLDALLTPFRDGQP